MPSFVQPRVECIQVELKREAMVSLLLVTGIKPQVTQWWNQQQQAQGFRIVPFCFCDDDMNKTVNTEKTKLDATVVDNYNITYE